MHPLWPADLGFALPCVFGFVICCAVVWKPIFTQERRVGFSLPQSLNNLAPWEYYGDRRAVALIRGLDRPTRFVSDDREAADARLGELNHPGFWLLLLLMGISDSLFQNV
jgi:hypothetical protein